MFCFFNVKCSACVFKHTQSALYFYDGENGPNAINDMKNSLSRSVFVKAEYAMRNQYSSTKINS